MTTLHDIPAWAALLTSALMLVGSSLTLIGAVGLVRLKSFYERVHAPTLGATLGMASILFASALYFSVSQTRPIVHEILIGIFVTVTTPVTLLLLVPATLYRDRLEGRDPLAAEGTDERRAPEAGPGGDGAQGDNAARADGRPPSPVPSTS